MRKLSKGFGLVILAYLLIVIGYSIPHNVPDKNIKRADKIKISLKQDPILIADAKLLGINYSDLNMSFAKHLLADDVKDGVAVAGTFQMPNNIKVKSGQNKHEELETLAYEYLHYKWAQYTPAKKAKLTKTYQIFYDADESFRRLSASIYGDKDVLADERNSIACTEVKPYFLTEGLNDYCNALIPNRRILFE